MGKKLFITIEVLILSITLLFGCLCTKVTDQTIELSFGIGLINKSINIAEIESTECVRNEWYYGLGIRYLGNGWLWNIGGLDAVELKYKNSDLMFRIGTNDATKLKEAIDKQLAG